jgi:hypothetical protein
LIKLVEYGFIKGKTMLGQRSHLIFIAGAKQELELEPLPNIPVFIFFIQAKG